jgi:hypothetical protein
MRFAVIFGKSSYNVGDDIQTIAAMQFLPKVDFVIDRERISEANVPEGTKIILNGWYMHNPVYWPASKRFKPLFISFHSKSNSANVLTERIANFVLGRSKKTCISKDHFNYFSQFREIGCRDKATKKQFDEIGIKSYFSGCLTLTLKSYSAKKQYRIVFCDPFGQFPGNRYRLDLWFQIKGSLRRNSLKVTHFTLIKSFGKRMELAEKLLTIYSEADVVVTSRLHTALPCIGMGVPVILISTNHRAERFLGYENIIQPVSPQKFIQEARSGNIMGLVSKPDLDCLRNLQQDLVSKCRDFIKS